LTISKTTVLQKHTSAVIEAMALKWQPGSFSYVAQDHMVMARNYIRYVYIEVRCHS
jgi:hypothetical protein